MNMINKKIQNMKKIMLSLLAMGLCVCLYAQQIKKEIHIDPMLYEVLSESQINDLRANNPAQLVRENCAVVSYCYLAQKMTEAEGTYQMKGDLKNYVKPGKNCDYQTIIARGCINRYDFNLEQDPYRQNVYSLGSTGAYIIVLSQEKFNRNQEAYLKLYGLE